MRVSRFAPSPSGLLHLGHAFSAFSALDAVRGGRFLLRLEDIDLTRCKREFEAAIIEDLHWLGIEWSEPPRRQSDHLEEYERALKRLIALGVMYRCFRTRREVMDAIVSAPHGDGEAFRGAPLAPAEENERLARGEAFAWRLSIDRARDLLGGAFDNLHFKESGAGPNGEHGVVRAEPAALGDVVLARKDFPTSYHLAACHDDALAGVTIIARGHDLFASTHVHVLLQRLLGWPTPEYRHHRLLLGPDGKRFAKRDRAATLASLREAGKKPADIRAMLT